MNDNKPSLAMDDLLDTDDPPEWVWDILDKHDLGPRTDCPQAAVTVLLTDAASILKEANLTSFHEQAVTPELRQRLADCRTMIVDAEKLSALCPTQPAAGSGQRHGSGRRNPNVGS